MKTLLLSALASLACLTGMAQGAGDYVYSAAHRLKITTGENLVSNGDFADGLNGWTTDGSHALSPDTFQIVSDGPDGSQCLYVAMKDNGPGTGSSLLRKIPVRAGNTYYISYSVKADEEVTTTVTDNYNGKNYQNVFFNTDGSTNAETAIAKTQNYSVDWDTISYSVTAPSNGYIVFHFYGPYTGTRFDNFRVLEAVEVADDRLVNAAIARLQAYIDNPLFPNGHETMNEVIAELNALLATDDNEAVTELLATVENEVIPAYLDLNTVNVSQYLLAPDFDALATTSALKSGTGTTYGNAWTVTGLRWKVAGADDTFTTNHISRSIPGGYSLDEGRLYQTTTLLPAGKYMFTMKANALRYKDKNETVMDNYDIRGMKIYVNGDSTECFPIDTARVTTYEVYADVREGEPVTVGFYMPAGVANVVNLDFTQLRAIGTTQEAIEAYVGKRQLDNAKATLKVSIDSATVYTHSADYIYDKDSLTVDIAAAQAVYDASQDADEVTAQTDSLNGAIRTFLKHNNIYRTLVAAIANAEGKLADDSYTTGRDALEAALATAKSHLATLPGTDRTADDAASLAQTEALNQAVSDFIVANSTSGQDEVFSFAQWADIAEPVYPTQLSTEGITTSGGATLYPETATFVGNNIGNRFAFLNTNCKREATGNGLEVNCTSKNATAMAITNLVAGDQVTVDWAMGNAKHSVYISSGNATYVNANGETVSLTLKGSKAKTASHKLNNDNTDGVAGQTRTVLTMTADGTLDFFLGSSNSTLRIGFVGIKHADPTGISSVSSGDAEAESSDESVYSLGGQRVASGVAALRNLPKGIYIYKGRKIAVK